MSKGSEVRLAIVHNLPSGGALRSANAQAARLARHHELELFTLSTADPELARWPAGLHQQVYAYAPSAPLERPFGMFDPLMKLNDLMRLEEVYRRMAAEIDRRGFDAVLVHPCRFTQAPRALAHLAAPSVYYCHEPPRALHEPPPEPPPAPRSLWESVRAWRHRPLAFALRKRLVALDRAACRAASAVAVNSRYTAANVERLYGRTPELVYHGVDAEKFTPDPDAARQHVLSVGALSPWKGFDLAIDALGQVPAPQRPPLVLVSDRADGGYAEALSARAIRAGVRLSVRARIADDELVRLYRGAHFTIYTPVREPFGLVPLESMACGTPVVGVREGGVPESVEDGVTGLLCARDAGALAEAARQLIADPARAAALGRSGREAVLARWTWDASVLALEAILTRVAGRP